MEEQRQQQERVFRGGRQDAPLVSCHLTTADHPSSLEARLKSKFNTVRRSVMAMNSDLDIGDDDPYAFTDVDVKPADGKPVLNIGGPSVVPPAMPVVNNCHWNDLLVKMTSRAPGVLRTPAVPRVPGVLRTPAMPRVPGVLRTPAVPRVPGVLRTPAVPRVPGVLKASSMLRTPGAPLPTPTGPTAIAKLYPELAEKLELVRTSKSDSKVMKGSLNKSSRTMNRLQTKIAQNKLKDRFKRNKNRDRTIASRNSPQPIPSVISHRPIPSVITPRPITSVISSQPIPSVITPQPIPSVITPQPIASVISPQPIMSMITPQPIASMISPQPIMSVITPQPIASVISPRPIMSVITPQPISSVISPTPFSSLLATMERAVIAGVPTANLLLSEAYGDSRERTACPTVANHLLCNQLTSHIMPPCIDVTASGDTPQSSREIAQMIPMAGCAGTPARCRKATSGGVRKKRCAPNKRKSEAKLTGSEAKSIGSQRRNRSAAWKKKLGIVDIPPCNNLDVPVTLVAQQQLPLIAQPLPRLQLPICDLTLPNYVTSAGLDTTLTIPPQPSPLVPGQYQGPLMFPPPISSLPPPLFPPIVLDCLSIATSSEEAPLAFTCIRQRKCRPSSECSTQVKGRLHDSSAVDLYMRHTECRRRSNRVLPVGEYCCDVDKIIVCVNKLGHT